MTAPINDQITAAYNGLKARVLEASSAGDAEACMESVFSFLKFMNRFRNCDLQYYFDEDLNDQIVKCPDCGCRFHRAGHCQSFELQGIYDLFGSHGFEVVTYKIANFGFLATLGIFSRMFYMLQMHRFVKARKFRSNIFFVVRKR